MLRQLAAIVCLIGFSLAVFAAEPPKGEDGQDSYRAHTQAYFEKHITPLVAGMGKAKLVAVYEGLPHQNVERELYDQELKKAKFVKLEGFPFYESPVAPGDASAKKLLELCRDVKSFQRWGGLKFCDGFHPDWCIELKDGDEVYRVLVCFRCHEVEICGPKHRLRCDLEEGAVKAFAASFPAAKNRPKPQPLKEPTETER